MKLRFILVALLASLLLASACRPSPPKGSAPSTFDVESISSALAATGLLVTSSAQTTGSIFPPPAQFFLLRVDSKTHVPDSGVNVFRYPTAREASLWASRVSADASAIKGVTSEIEWARSPHFFKRDRLIVLYSSRLKPQMDEASLDRQILDVLERQMGRPFVGGR